MRTRREGEDVRGEGVPTRQERAWEDVTATQVFGAVDGTETRVVGAGTAVTHHLDPRDETAPRQVSRADAAPTVSLDPAAYQRSPHGNRIGPQLRRLPAELDARYRPLRDLRGGSQADVVVAEDRFSGREVVIKLYRAPGNPYDAATSARLDRADHAHVVTVFERGSSNGCAWEVQEYCPHGTLLETPELQPLLSGARFHAVVTQLGLALVHLHGLSIVHRDLKPANVLVRSLAPLDLVLTDFGLSTEMAMSMDVGSIAGTFPYMPPEAHYGEIGRAGDWWALGVMAYQFLSGRHFLADENGRMPGDAKLRHVIATGGYVLDRVGDDRQWLLLRGLLTRDRKARWGSAQFQEWLSGGWPAVVPDAPAKPVAAPPSPPRTVVAAAPLPPATRVLPPASYAPPAPRIPIASPAPVSPPQPQPTEDPVRSRRLVRRTAEQGLRQQWRLSLVGRIFSRLAWAALWCLVAGTLLAVSTVTATPFFEVGSLIGELPAMFARYAPAAAVAAAVVLLAEAIFLRRQWPNRMLAVTGAIVGLQGTFSPDGTFLGLPVEVPLYFAGGWTFSLLMGWVTAQLGQSFPHGVPLTRFEANRQRPWIARWFLFVAHLAGALAGGAGLATWFFVVVPLPGGASAVIESLPVLERASSWLDDAIPRVDLLGLASDPYLLASFGLFGYLLALTANDLQRLARPLIWLSIAGALLAGLGVFFAVPGLIPLALIPALVALFTIRRTERPAGPTAAPVYPG